MTVFADAFGASTKYVGLVPSVERGSHGGLENFATVKPFEAPSIVAAMFDAPRRPGIAVDAPQYNNG